MFVKTEVADSIHNQAQGDKVIIIIIIITSEPQAGT